MTDTLALRLTTLLATTRKPGTDRPWTSRELVDAINARGDVSISYSYFSSLKVGVRDNPAVPVLRAIARELRVTEGSLIDTESGLGELPLDVRSLELTAEESRTVSEVARALIAARTLRDESVPAFTMSRPLEPGDAYSASEVAQGLADAARVLRADLGNDDLAAHLDAIAGRIRTYFGSAAVQDRAVASDTRVETPVLAD